MKKLIMDFVSFLLMISDHLVQIADDVLKSSPSKTWKRMNSP